MGYTQDNVYLSINTPLGKDALLLRSFHGEESLSNLFHFTLEMISEDYALDFEAIVGQSVTVEMGLANGQKRYLNGIIGRFYQAGTDARFTTYYAELHPWLWLLTKTADCRIFQAQSVPEIVETVFQELGFTDYRLALTESYDKREYTVQFQETAFHFVSRLLEEEGIFYFFEHEATKHTLVLADAANSHQLCPGLSGPVRYESSLAVSPPDDVITHCTFEQQVTTSKVSVDDFNFETPATDLIVNMAGEDGDLRIYNYPGYFINKGQGNWRAKVRLQSYELPQRLLCGDGISPAFTSGYRFEMVGFDRDEVNSRYVLQKVTHQATVTHYTNTFQAFPSEVPYRPPIQTPRPLIPGTQTAIVVGKSGEEIWTDQYGRIKVLFHWDQLGKGDENSSCWIRVAQSWAGKGWGGLFIPRIGQEVIVSFINGDPDRPLVTGAVYNAQQTVPYSLPSEQTKSTIKSNSSKGGDGFNEIRFEDKKGDEEIFVHAQKDNNIVIEHDRTKEVGNDETNTIQQNRTTTIQEGHESLTVAKGNRTIQVDTGNEIHEVKGKRDLTITGNESHTNQANFRQDVTGNYTLKVGGNLTIDVTGSISIKAGMNVNNEAGMNMTQKAGLSMNNEAGLSMTSKGGATNTVEGGGITTIKGGIVTIN